MRHVTTAIILATCLAACGDDTEAKLAACKSDMLAFFDTMLDKTRTASDVKPMVVQFMQTVGRQTLEKSLAKMTGPDGLATCTAALAKNRAGNGA